MLDYADNHSSVFSFVLTDGGTALLFWGFIAIGLGMMLVYASLAEMASMYVYTSLTSTKDPPTDI
jgi:amino acid permease